MKTTFKTTNNGKEKRNRRTLKVLQEDTSYIKLLLTTFFKLSAGFLSLAVVLKTIELAIQTPSYNIDLTLMIKQLCQNVLSILIGAALFQSGKDSVKCLYNVIHKGSICSIYSTLYYLKDITLLLLEACIQSTYFLINHLPFKLNKLAECKSVQEMRDFEFQQKEYICPNKVYENKGGKIIQTLSATCPFCEIKPYGKMKLWEITSAKQTEHRYEFICTHQQSHHIPYDHKKIYHYKKKH